MDPGTPVYRGHAFLSTAGEPVHYIEEGRMTGLEQDGKPLVRIERYDGLRLEPVGDAWHADGRRALIDARRKLDKIEQEFMERMASARAAVAERIEILDNAGTLAEVQG